jgi:hypothetical protein
LPPVSEAQRKLFRWAASDPKAAAKRGIKPSVAREYNAADPGGKLPQHTDQSRAEKRYGKK